MAVVAVGEPEDGLLSPFVVTLAINLALYGVFVVT
jgi:hypothetical protein